jgi:hypothetical protein
MALHTRQLMRVADVVDACQYSYRRVLAAIRTGELPAVDISPRGSKRPEYRIDPLEYDTWLRGKLVVHARAASHMGDATRPTSRQAQNVAYREAA